MFEPLAHQIPMAERPISQVEKPVLLSPILPPFPDLSDHFQPESRSSRMDVSPVPFLDDFQEKNRIAPTFEEVKQGASMERGHTGQSVKELQHRLTAIGFGVKDTGIFGVTTETVLKDFQNAYQVQPTGKFGPTTLNVLEKAEQEPQYDSKLGTLLAREASRTAYSRRTVGWCYNAVAAVIDRSVGRFLYGRSAYMAANQLARHPKFEEIKIKHPDALRKLPLGAVVVWGKTPRSPNGHISIALGNGKEASDHVASQLTTLRGYRNMRVFLPVKSK